MGYGTDFTCEIFLNRMVFQNKSQIENAIDECKTNIETDTQQLMMLVSATPRYIVPDEWNEEPVRWLANQATELINAIADNMLTLSDLNRYLEVYDEQSKEV